MESLSIDMIVAAVRAVCVADVVGDAAKARRNADRAVECLESGEFLAAEFHINMMGFELADDARDMLQAARAAFNPLWTAFVGSSGI